MSGLRQELQELILHTKRFLIDESVAGQYLFTDEATKLFLSRPLAPEIKAKPAQAVKQIVQAAVQTRPAASPSSQSAHPPLFSEKMAQPAAKPFVEQTFPVSAPISTPEEKTAVKRNWQLEAMKECVAEDLTEIANRFRKIFPAAVYTEQPPLKRQAPFPQALILASRLDDQERRLLENIAVAITANFMPAAVLECSPNALPESDLHKLLIAPAEWKQSFERCDIPVIFMRQASDYLREPSFKKELWQAICALCKAEP